MAFGFPPKYIENLEKIELTNKQALFLALETAKRLNWNIGVLNKTGFIAYTKFSMSSWSEEVLINIEEGRINLKSQCTGNQLVDWGKNKKNIRSFVSTFNVLKTELSPEEVEEKSTELETKLEPEEGGVSENSSFNRNGKEAGFFSFFIPTEGYYITPILININIAIFILMTIYGVSMMQPDGESLLAWGANFSPLTLNGEWWRILSSCFIHIGIFHLLMNMYALLYIGMILEPYLGKSRFLSAYLLTGIIGSVASLYWNELTISAGASGAIFGMYGLFLAMLTTNIIEKSARKALLTSIAVFVGYNLLNGMNSGIDNAAHIGGLVSGLVIGYSFYPSLVKPTVSKLKYSTIGILSVAILAISIFVLSTSSVSDMNKYEQKMQEFSLLEDKALALFTMPETSTNQEYLDEIQRSGIPSWESNLRLLKEFEKMDLPDSIRERNSKLKKYCNLRLKMYETLYQAISENTDQYESQIEEYNKEIEMIIQDLRE